MCKKRSSGWEDGRRRWGGGRAAQAYGNELEEAHAAIKKYLQSGKDSDLHQAWDLYYHVFKRINKQLPSLVQLELQYVAPALIRAQVLPLLISPSHLPSLRGGF